MRQIDSLEFYTMFRKMFARPEISKYYQKEVSDKRWTALVLDHFLKPLGENLGFQVVREKGGRVDERWQENGRDVVAIEHENWGEKIESTMHDVRKLLSLEAPLKVAITYVSPNKMDYFVRAWTRAILHELKKRPATWELLLILGGYTAINASDWFGVSFQPTYEARPLFYTASSAVEREEIVNRWVRKEH